MTTKSEREMLEDLASEFPHHTQVGGLTALDLVRKSKTCPQVESDWVNNFDLANRADESLMACRAFADQQEQLRLAAGATS